MARADRKAEDQQTNQHVHLIRGTGTKEAKDVYTTPRGKVSKVNGLPSSVNRLNDGNDDARHVFIAICVVGRACLGLKYWPFRKYQTGRCDDDDERDVRHVARWPVVTWRTVDDAVCATRRDIFRETQQTSNRIITVGLSSANKASITCRAANASRRSPNRADSWRARGRAQNTKSAAHRRPKRAKRADDRRQREGGRGRENASERVAWHSR